MIEIIGVRFRDVSKEYYFDPRGITVHVGDEVIIETAKGIEWGKCSRANTQMEDQDIPKPLRPMIRLATEQDRERLKANKVWESKAMAICAGKIVAHGLAMKLVRCECSFDGSKLLFFFTSAGRVDFRALVKDLASTFHTRIELRQIGVRDASKILGGMGICGQPFCCSAFLDQFQPVSIKMAKTQGLSLNPVKISGSCGRLMCCLKYEQDAYEDAVRRLPCCESFVETPDGVGTIIGVDYLREKVKVHLEDQPDVLPQNYSPDELNIVRAGRGRRPEGYVAPPLAELEKLRKNTPSPLTPPDTRKALDQSIHDVLSNLTREQPIRKPKKSPVDQEKSETPKGKGAKRVRGRGSGGPPVRTDARAYPQAFELDDEDWALMPREERSVNRNRPKKRKNNNRPGGKNTRNEK